MTRMQAGVNMVPGAERQGMLDPNRRYITTKPTRPEPKAALSNQTEGTLFIWLFLGWGVGAGMGTQTYTPLQPLSIVWLPITQ